MTSKELRGETGETISVNKESFPKEPGEMQEHVERRRTDTDAGDGSDSRSRKNPPQVIAGGDAESAAKNGKRQEESGDIIDRAADAIVDGAWEGIKRLFNW